MKHGFALSLLVSLAPLAFSQQGLAVTYKFGENSGSIKWLGKKVSGQHDGLVKLKEGALDPEAKGEKGRFVIDMTSIENIDLKDSAEYKKKLEDHLKSADFFNVEKYPQATLVIKELKPDAKDKTLYTAKGDLTIKGITKPVEMPATIVEKDGKATVKSSFKVNRLDWDIRYNSGKFFDVKKLGDKIIDDQVQFDVNLEGNKA